MYLAPGAPAASSGRRTYVLLFLTAVVVYSPALSWGLPDAGIPELVHPWGADELGPLGPLAESHAVFLASDPDTFNPQYPLFHYLIGALFTAPYVAWLWLTGGLAGLSTAYPFGLADPVESLRVLTLLSRVPSVLMASGTVAVGAWTAGQWWDRRAVVPAGLAVLLVYPLIYYARTSNVDAPALFWTALGIAVFARCVRSGLTVRRALWLGLFAALSTATKDPGYAAFAGIAGALVWLRLAHPPEDRAERRRWNRAVAAGVTAAAVVYVLASGLVFSPERYRQHVGFILEGSGVNPYAYGRFSLTLVGLGELAVQVGDRLLHALGLPLVAASLAGVWLSARREPRTLLLLLPGLGVLLGVVLPAGFVRLRFVLVPAYLLALYAGYALAAAISAGRGGAPRRRALVAATVVLGWGAVRGADLTWQMLEDSRYGAARWLERHAEAGDRVGYYGSAIKLPHLPEGVHPVPMPGQRVFDPEEGGWVPLEPPAGRDGSVPEFVLVIPVQEYEGEHEWTLSPEEFRRLERGGAGVAPVAAVRAGSLFDRGISFVNPPVRLYVRPDRELR